MNATYQEFTKTFIQHGKKSPHVHERDVKVNYDSNQAKVDINVNRDGKKESRHEKLTSHDLENILNIPAINMPIYERLVHDFKPKPKSKSNPKSKPKTKKKKYPSRPRTMRIRLL
jgi:hypothetical protein